MLVPQNLGPTPSPRQEKRQASGPRHLTLSAIIIGSVSILGSALAGYAAYAHSREVIRQIALTHNLNLARIMKAHAEMAPVDSSLESVLANLESFWGDASKAHDASHLCVVGPDSRLLMNTKRRDKVGTLVGEVTIPALSELGVSSIKGLLDLGADWVGHNRSHAGELQVVAYAYAPKWRILIAVHLPESEVNREVLATSLPWALGWGFMALILTPASIALLLRAFTISQRNREVAFTRARQAEQEVRRSRDFLSVALNEFPLLIWRAGVDAKWNYVNQTWINFTGRPMDEQLGDSWIESVYPDDRTKRVEEYHQAFTARKPFNMEYRLRCRDGTYHWVSDWGRPLINRNGTFEGYIGGCQDISQRKETEKVLQRQSVERDLSNERLHTLSRRLMEIQETERHHLARELHDEIGQLLTVTRLNLQALRDAPAPNTFEGRLDDSIDLVDRLLEQIRHLSLDLRPPLLDDLGLKPALKWYLNQQSKRSGLQIRFISKLSAERFDPTLETTCFRVVQEAVTNIIRHANASHATVELIQEGNGLRLTVIDDGDGFDVTSESANAARGASFGLISIEERLSLIGGQLILSSMPGQGTQLLAIIDLSGRSVSKNTGTEASHQRASRKPEAPLGIQQEV